MWQLLHESDELMVEYAWEDVRITSKLDGKILAEYNFYGEVSVCQIDQNNKWVLLASEKIIFLDMRKPTYSISEIIINEGNENKFIEAVRQINEYEIEILTDPWGVSPSIYILNLKTLQYQKSRDFLKYRNKPFVDNIEW